MGEILFCNHCGMANAPGAQFCSSCGASMNPGASPAATAPVPPVPTPYPATAGAASPAAAPYQAATAGVRYGGFWIRVVAFIIDAIIVRVPVHIVGAVLGLGGLAAGGFGLGGLGHGAALPLMIFGGGVLALLTIAGSWLYEAFMLSSPLSGNARQNDLWDESYRSSGQTHFLCAGHG